MPLSKPTVEVEVELSKVTRSFSEFFSSTGCLAPSVDDFIVSLALATAVGMVPNENPVDALFPFSFASTSTADSVTKATAAAGVLLDEADEASDFLSATAVNEKKADLVGFSVPVAELVS